MKMKRFAAASLLIYTLSMTFAATDWFMSLEPEWFSTMYGPLFWIGQALTTFAFVILILILLLRPRGVLPWSGQGSTVGWDRRTRPRVERDPPSTRIGARSSWIRKSRCPAAAWPPSALPVARDGRFRRLLRIRNGTPRFSSSDGCPGLARSLSLNRSSQRTLAQ